MSALTSDPSDAELHAFGYAPGNYTSKCLDCDGEMWGVDKRCHVCRPCAVKRFHKPREALSSNPDLPRIPPKHLKDGCYARADALEAHLNAAKVKIERLQERCVEFSANLAIAERQVTEARMEIDRRSVETYELVVSPEPITHLGADGRAHGASREICEICKKAAVKATAAPLIVRCDHCGTDYTPTHGFCAYCGKYPSVNGSASSLGKDAP